MNGNFLAGVLVGLFVGGVIGTLAMAMVAAGSEQRFTRALVEVAWARPASPSGQTWGESSMRVDLLADRRGARRRVVQPSAEVDDIDQELRALVRRYGTASES